MSTERRVNLGDFNGIPDLSDLELEFEDVGLDSWRPVDMAAMPEHPAILPNLGMIDTIGLVYPGKRHVFSGPQESAKTLVTYAIGIQVIRDGGSIVLIDFEMGPYDARARLRDLGITAGELARVRYVEPDTPATEERVATLLALEPQLVIVDAAAGAYDIQGLDDNKRQDVERFSRLYVRPFWKAGIATIVIDHVTKSAEGRGKYAIGSERKVGGADVHLGFEVVSPISRGRSGIYGIFTHKDRSGNLKRGKLAELTLRSDIETHAITCSFEAAEETPEGALWMPTKVMEKISSKLELIPETELSRKAILTEVGGREEIARQALDHLVRLGFVSETAGAHGAKLVKTIRAFTVFGWEAPTT